VDDASSNSGWQWETEMRHTLPLADLLFAKKELHVTPIISNKQIEVIPPLKFKPETLPFGYKSAQALSELDTHDLERFLTVVFKHVSHRSISVRRRAAIALPVAHVRRRRLLLLLRRMKKR
jgi:hypothetical protein